MALLISLAIFTSPLPAFSARSKHKMQQNYTYQIVDTQSVSTTFPELSVRKGNFTDPDYIVDCDIFIAGGGTGGVAAALRATSAQMGKRGLGGP